MPKPTTTTSYSSPHSLTVDASTSWGVSVLLLLLGVIEELLDVRWNVGELEVRHARLGSGEVGEVHAPGHDALPDQFCAGRLGDGHPVAERLRVGCGDAHVMQSGARRVEEL